jgi:hypothetical protein
MIAMVSALTSFQRGLARAAKDLTPV